MIKILICDDDQSVIEKINCLIENFTKKYNTDFNIDSRSSGDFILSEKNKYDIAFIDIEMPGISGLNLATELKKQNPDVIVIVVTSFQSYLDDAMRIHVFRYLSKPIDANRFYENFKDAIAEYKSFGKIIYVEKQDEVYKIRTKDIMYIESQKHGSQIVTKNEALITNKKAKEWEATIAQPDCFVHSHTSCIVNLQNVIDFSKDSVTLRGNNDETATVYMSMRRYTTFKKAFFSFAGGLK